MLNPKTLSIIKSYTNIFTSVGSSLYEWNETQECLTVTKKLRRKITFAIAVINSIFYLIFLLWREVELVNHQNPSFPAIIWQIIWIQATVWALVTFYNGSVKKSQVVTCFNGIKLLTEKLLKGKKDFYKSFSF
jgi:hypothetical protein